MKYGRANFQPIIITVESIEEAIALYTAVSHVALHEVEEELVERGIEVPSEHPHPAFYQIERLQEFLEKVIEDVA